MRKHKQKKLFGNQNEGYLFILPIFLFFAVYQIYPLIFNIYCSMLDWNGISADKVFVGLANFKKLFNDPTLYKILKNTFFYFIGTIFPQAFFGIVLAHILTRRIRHQNFFRAILYFPNLIPMTIVCLTFKKIFAAAGGDMNVMLQSLGLDFLCQPWLAKPNLALFTLIAINVWTYTSFSMLLYCVSMTNISSELYEAAIIDGANERQQFFHITFPLLGNTHATLILLGLISVVKNFDIPFLITGGGPAHATEFFSTYLYNYSFERFDQGMSSAIVCVMMVLCLICSILQLRMNGVQLKHKEI